MMWSKSKIKNLERWRTWFAFVPTIVHENDFEVLWIWLERYKWRYRESGAIERSSFWICTDPYIVPNSTWRP